MTEDYFIFTCPHCDDKIIVAKNELNCRIFRHGILRSNGQQINPHSPKELCDFYVANERIYGCGKPFKVVEDELTKEFKTVICDYI